MKKENEIFNKNQLHPKTKNRFVVEISEPWNFPSYLIKSITRPSITSKGIVVETLKLKLYDPIAPTTSGFIWQYIRQDKGDITVSMKLKVLGPIGDDVEEYNITGKFSYFDFGELDWSKDEPAEITAYFEVYECIHEY